MMAIRTIIFLIVFLLVWPVNAITVKAINDIDSNIIDNINAHLSLYAAPEKCRISAKYRKKLYASINQSLQALGYYRFEIVELSPSSEETCQQWLINLTLDSKVTINQLIITLDGEGSTDAELISVVDNFPIKTGNKLDHKAYEQGKSALANMAILRGYFDFTYDKKEILVDSDNNNAVLTLAATTGKRYRFGHITSELDDNYATLVENLKPFSFGELYDATQLTLFIQRLKQSAYFQQVIVRPILHQAENNIVPLELIYQLKPQDKFDIGGGYSSDTRLRGKVNWQRPRINEAGHSIETELFVSAPEQSLSLKYRIPLADPANNFLSFQAGVLSITDNDTNSETYTLAAKRHWVDPADKWQKIAFIRFDLEQFSQGSEPKESTFLTIPGFTLSRLKTDGGLDPAFGDRQMFTVEVASDQLASDIDFARITAQTKWLYSVDEHRFLVRAELGALATDEFDAVPSTLRYFAGGDQSVRGFGYQSLAPLDDGNELLGGKYLYTSSVEYSIPVYEKWRMAFFADAGNAGNELFENIATGVGSGVHWLSPIGTVRFYLARGNNELEKTWRIHFSMGPVL